MNELKTIKRNDFVKYLKCIYLVKDFQKLDNATFIISYYFRASRKAEAKIRINDVFNISSYNLKKIKKATSDETDFLIEKIKLEHPNFDLSFYVATKKECFLNENECIEFLKNKGYLVYKQV